MEKGFKIICLKCKSENVSIREEIDYDYEENPYSTGCYYLQCENCGNNEI